MPPLLLIQREKNSANANFVITSDGGLSRILVQENKIDQSWMFRMLEVTLAEACSHVELCKLQFKMLARHRVDAWCKENQLATGIDSRISTTIEYLQKFQTGLGQSMHGLSSRISNRSNPGPPDAQPQGYLDILRSDHGHGASALNASQISSVKENVDLPLTGNDHCRSHYLCVHNQSDGTRCPAKRTVDHRESGEVILESQKGEHVHGTGLAMAASDDVPGGDASKAARTAPDQYQMSGSVEGGHGKMSLSLSTAPNEIVTAGHTHTNFIMSGGGLSRSLVQGKWMLSMLEERLDEASFYLEHCKSQFKELARRRVHASSIDNPLSRSSAAAEMEAIMATGIDSHISRAIEHLLKFQTGLRQLMPDLSSQISNRSNPGPPDAESGTEANAEDDGGPPVPSDKDSIVPLVTSEPRLPPVNSEAQILLSQLWTPIALPAGNPDEGSPWVQIHHEEIAKGIMRSHYLCVHNQSDGTRCPAKRTVDHCESKEVILESYKGEHIHRTGLAIATSSDVLSEDASKPTHTTSDQYHVSGSVEGGQEKGSLSLSTAVHDTIKIRHNYRN